MAENTTEAASEIITSLPGRKDETHPALLLPDQRLNLQVLDKPVTQLRDVKETETLPLDYEQVITEIRDTLGIGPEHLPVQEPSNREKLIALGSVLAIKRNALSVPAARELIKSVLSVSGIGDKHIKIKLPDQQVGSAIHSKRDSIFGTYASYVLNPKVVPLWYPPHEREAIKMETHRLSDFDHVLPVNDVGINDEQIRQNIAEILLDNQHAFPWKENGIEKRTYQLIDNEQQVKFIHLDDYLVPWKLDELPDDSVVVVRALAPWQGTVEKELFTRLRDKNRMVIILQDDQNKTHLGDSLQIIAAHKWIDGLPVGHLATKVAEDMGGVRDVDDDTLSQILTEADVRFNFGDNNAHGAIRSKVFNKEEVGKINELYHRYKDKLPTESLKKKMSLPVFLQYLFHQSAGSVGSALAFSSDIKIQLDQYRMPGTLEKLTECIENQEWTSVAAMLDIYGRDVPEGQISERSNIRGIIGKALEQIDNQEERNMLAALTSKNHGTKKDPFSPAAGLSGQTMTSVLPKGYKSVDGYGGPAAAGFQRGPVMTLTTTEENGDLQQLILRTKANWNQITNN